MSSSLFTTSTDRLRLVSSYELSVEAGGKTREQEYFISARQITASDMGASQEDWEVSSLDLRNQTSLYAQC